jgi:hypothetical protein
MKKLLPLFLVLALLGCNDKPDLQPIDTKILFLYPSAVLDFVFISVATTPGETYTLSVFDTSGKTLFESNVPTDRPEILYRIPLEGKPKGNYQAILRSSKKTLIRNFVKL